MKFARFRKEHHDGKILTYFPFSFWILRTQKTSFLDWFKRFAGILVKALPVITLAGILMIIFQGWIAGSNLVTLNSNPGVIPARFASAQNLFLIPGLNDFVPLSVEVLLAFFVTMVIHELGHGIFARILDVPVKAMGFVFALIIPFAAFVELDGEILAKKNWMKEITIYSTGPYANLISAFLVFLIIIISLSSLLKYGFMAFVILMFIPLDPMMGGRLPL